MRTIHKVQVYIGGTTYFSLMMLEGAKVVFVEEDTQENLFLWIEHESSLGWLMRDFILIYEGNIILEEYEYVYSWRRELSPEWDKVHRHLYIEKLS